MPLDHITNSQRRFHISRKLASDGIPRLRKKLGLAESKVHPTWDANEPGDILIGEFIGWEPWPNWRGGWTLHALVQCAVTRKTFAVGWSSPRLRQAVNESNPEEGDLIGILRLGDYPNRIRQYRVEIERREVA